MKSIRITTILTSWFLASAMVSLLVGCSDEVPTVAPVTDFDLQVTQDGKALKITKYKGSAKHLIIPDSIEGLPVVAIGTFYNIGNFDGLYGANYKARQGLESVVIPEGVRLIGANVFDHCTNLASVTLPNSLQVIMPRAFYECTNLTTIKLPNSIVALGEEVFTASGLTTITIPKAMKFVGRHSFASCDKLKEVNIEDDWSPHLIVYGELSDGLDFTQVFMGDVIRDSRDIREMLRTRKFSHVEQGDSAVFKDFLISVNF